MQTRARVSIFIAGLVLALSGVACHAQSSFTLVRAQTEQAGGSGAQDDVLEQAFGSSFATTSEPGWYGKGRVSFGNAGAYAVSTRSDRETFGETWWADGFTVTGGSGQGELTIRVSVSGTAQGEGAANYALFSRETAFGELELSRWLDCPPGREHCSPDAPLGAQAIIPMTTSFPASGTTVLTGRLAFTYGETFYLASYFGAETWGIGEASFYGSAHFGITVPADTVLVTGSGTTYLAAAAVPEPATLLMMAMGLAGLLGWRRRQSNVA